MACALVQYVFMRVCVVESDAQRSLDRKKHTEQVVDKSFCNYMVGWEIRGEGARQLA